MHLLICSATELEIDSTSGFLKNNTDSNTEILISGVGMLQTSYMLTRHINKRRPDIIIQAGIAGCLSDNLNPGDVVLVKNDMIGDLGVIEKDQFVSVFDMNLIHQNEFPWENRKLPNKNGFINNLGLKLVDGVTVNEITTNVDRINQYKNLLNAQIESMEGAALHYISLMEDIPFLQIRSISNYVGERDKAKWNMKKAIYQLNFELQRILNKLKNL